MSELEGRSKELEDANAVLEEKVSTLQRENFMLRQVKSIVTLSFLAVHFLIIAWCWEQIVKNTALKRSTEDVS